MSETTYNYNDNYQYGKSIVYYNIHRILVIYDCILTNMLHKVVSSNGTIVQTIYSTELIQKSPIRFGLKITHIMLDIHVHIVI